MAELTEKARSLIDEPNFAFLATVDEDGSPQVSPVWIDREDGRVLVNTAAGRVKDRNMRRDPRVALSIANRENAYDKVDIRGRVVDVVEGDEAESHIDKMAFKYMGEETYPMRQPGERRVVFKIEPQRVSEMA
jgi:PPOX class probable F420-dependent enzyme